ncbi:uncharacterized protein EHS24_009692 [Apiotrichum porosum]|uniref:Uncharacterized protein n=1 Tax=Apiotrichum porosum TaxID=105984 RepID=A0A427XM98_9TREE|nr:uncharacterized protein EHS24_009692 [Apiotrichum porosum]RSH80021.1 hypothetical protein EHS24_009692 [Apiotrichum porosum]
MAVISPVPPSPTTNEPPPSPQQPTKATKHRAVTVQDDEGDSGDNQSKDAQVNPSSASTSRTTRPLPTPLLHATNRVASAPAAVTVTKTTTTTTTTTTDKPLPKPILKASTTAKKPGYPEFRSPWAYTERILPERRVVSNTEHYPYDDPLEPPVKPLDPLFTSAPNSPPSGVKKGDPWYWQGNIIADKDKPSIANNTRFFPYDDEGGPAAKPAVQKPEPKVVEPWPEIIAVPNIVNWRLPDPLPKAPAPKVSGGDTVKNKGAQTPRPRPPPAANK